MYYILKFVLDTPSVKEYRKITRSSSKSKTTAKRYGRVCMEWLNWLELPSALLGDQVEMSEREVVIEIHKIMNNVYVCVCEYKNMSYTVKCVALSCYLPVGCVVILQKSY